MFGDQKIKGIKQTKSEIFQFFPRSSLFSMNSPRPMFGRLGEALERRFQPVSVPEPTNEEAVQILRGIARKYEVRCWWGWMVGCWGWWVGWLALEVEIEPRKSILDQTLPLGRESFTWIVLKTILGLVWTQVQVPHPWEDFAQSLTGSPPHPLLRRSLAILREVCVAVHPGTNHQQPSAIINESWECSS